MRRKRYLYGVLSLSLAVLLCGTVTFKETMAQAPQITNPSTPAITLGSAAQFIWTATQNATEYELWDQSKWPYLIYNNLQGSPPPTTTSVTIPADRGPWRTYRVRAKVGTWISGNSRLYQCSDPNGPAAPNC